MKNKKVKKIVCKCDTCCKEIPKSVAMTAEGKDYVWHLCSQCYKKFQTNDKKPLKK